MSLSEEIGRLGDLHQRGMLTDDEFARAKARLLDDTAPRVAPPAAFATVNGLRRSVSDRWLGGVCGGLAQTTGVAGWLWRLGFVLMLLCAGSGALLYLLLWLLLPSEERPAPVSGSPLRTG